MQLARSEFIESVKRSAEGRVWQYYAGVHDIFDQQLIHDVVSAIDDPGFRGILRRHQMLANYYLHVGKSDILDWADSLIGIARNVAYGVIVSKIFIDISIVPWIIGKIDAFSDFHMNPRVSPEAATYLYTHGIRHMHPRVWPNINVDKLDPGIVYGIYIHGADVTDHDLEIIERMHVEHQLPPVNVLVSKTTTAEVMRKYRLGIIWVLSDKVFVRGLTCQEMMQYMMYGNPRSTFAMADDTLDNIIRASDWHIHALTNPSVDKQEYLHRFSRAHKKNAEVDSEYDRREFQAAETPSDATPYQRALEYQRQMRRCQFVPEVFALIVFACDGLLQCEDFLSSPECKKK